MLVSVGKSWLLKDSFRQTTIDTRTLQTSKMPENGLYQHIAEFEE